MQRNSTHWLTFLTVLLLSIVLTSCAKPKAVPRTERNTPVAGDPNAGTSTGISNQNLQGTWKSQCEVDYDSDYETTYGFTSKIVISGNNISEELKYFYDESCTEQWDATENKSATFSIAGNSQAVSGAQEINLSAGLPDVRPYNIVKASGSQLQFGEVYNGDGKDGRSAANRPTSLSYLKYSK